MRTLFDLFKPASLLDKARRELAEAEMSQLHAFSVREHADSVISYNNARIKRLRTYLASLSR